MTVPNKIDMLSLGRYGVHLLPANTVIPAGQYTAVAFLGGGGSFTTGFTATEAPYLTGTKTGITFADGFVLLTPITIAAGSLTRINCPVALYKDD